MAGKNQQAGRDRRQRAVSAAGGSGNKQATASATYRFDGDIRQAAKSRRFGFQDTVTLRFEISGVGTPQDAPLAVRVDDLILSTADVAETNGHAALEFRAGQGNDVLWQWSARVEQGKTPQISVATGNQERIGAGQVNHSASGPPWTRFRQRALAEAQGLRVYSEDIAFYRYQHRNDQELPLSP